MRYPPLIEATIVERINRFVVRVKIKSRFYSARLPNTGRLAELLVSGTQALCIPAPDDKPDRKTKFDLALVRYHQRWVSVNSHLANTLFAEAVNKRTLAEFNGLDILKREITTGRSRLDFLLSGNNRKVYVEVKSVTLVKKARAYFPDAPTERGKKHLKELADLVRKGYEAAAVFVVQRNDALSFTPNWETDRAFANALIDVQKKGVRVFAYRCAVGEKIIRVIDRIPFEPYF